MRIAYIIGTYPQLSTTFIDREVAEMRSLGLELAILSIRRPPAEAKPSGDRGEIIYLLPAIWWAFLTAHLRWALMCPARYFGLLAFLVSRPHPGFGARFKTFLHFGEGAYAAWILEKKRPEHVHAHFIDRAATVAICVSRLLDVPYSITAHANDIFVKPLLIPEKLRLSTFTVTASGFNRTHLLATCPDVPPDKVHVLHAWVDLNVFRPARKHPSGNTLRILSVGRLVEKKGHQHLIAACGILRDRGIDFCCEIIGQGPLHLQLEEQIVGLSLEDQVELLGACEGDEVIRRLASCDVFALPCTIAEDGDRDGMPVALAEAMAMEVPVVATEILGISEMVRPGTGLLVPEANPAALADAIETLHKAGPRARKEIGKRARAVIAHSFSVGGCRDLARQFTVTAEARK